MPAAISITRLDYTAAELRREAKRTDDADAARRMLALALVLEGKSRRGSEILRHGPADSLRLGSPLQCGRSAGPSQSNRSRSQTGTRGGRVGSQRTEFGRAWGGALAPDRSVACDRATLRGQ